jgi:hypothetical protein
MYIYISSIKKMVKEEEKERRTQHPGLIFMLGRDTITVIIHGTLCRKETIFFKKESGATRRGTPSSAPTDTDEIEFK